MLISMFDPEDEDMSWQFRPKGEEGDWERCRCDCHRFRCGMVMHCVPCCMGGWKKTFQLLGKEYQAELAKRQKSATYKPAHGGYPDVVTNH